MGMANFFPLKIVVKYAGEVDPFSCALQGLTVTRGENDYYTFWANHHEMDMTSFCFAVRGCLDSLRIEKSSSGCFCQPSGYMIVMPPGKLDEIHDSSLGSRKVSFCTKILHKMKELGYDGLLVCQDLRKFYGWGPGRRGNVFRFVEFDGTIPLTKMLQSPNDLEVPEGQVRKNFWITDWDLPMKQGEMFDRIAWAAMDVPQPTMEGAFSGINCYTNGKGEYTLQLVGDLAAQPKVASKLMELTGGNLLSPGETH